MGNIICMGKKATVEICLVPETREIDNEQIKEDIRKTLKCDWSAEIEKVTVKTEQ